VGEPDQLDAWLDPELKDLATLQLMLQPCADEVLEAYAVSDAVNRVGHEGPELVAPRA
jgi:putative SOS response-associated peptidase YedK